ncbi:MAG: GNAT family N-acetyltransferase [Pseudomonadales bacterium]
MNSDEQTQRPITVRRLRAADARSLSECFRRCYGETYPADIFYDTGKLHGAIASGQLRSVVAVTAGNRVVGHTGLTIRHPQARAIEAGNTIVDPDYRGHGLLGRLGAALTDLCSSAGYIGYLHYPTTAHDIMQKRSVSGGGVETGIMLGYIPAETDYRAVDRQQGRLAATVVYQPMPGAAAPLREGEKDGSTPAPTSELSPTPPSSLRVCHAPARYRTLLETLFAATALSRNFLPGDAVWKPVSDIRHQFYPRRGLLQLYLQSSGADLVDRVLSLCGQTQPAIVHADLPLDDPGIDATVDALIGLGFRFCALLPEFAHTDLLRMQWLTGTDPRLHAPSLANPDARALLEVINADHQGACD